MRWLASLSLVALERVSRLRDNSASSGAWTPSTWAEVLSSWRASSADPGTIGLITWGARPDDLNWFLGRVPVGLLPAHAPYNLEKARAYASRPGDPPPLILVAKPVRHAYEDRDCRSKSGTGSIGRMRLVCASNPRSLPTSGSLAGQPTRLACWYRVKGFPGPTSNAMAPDLLVCYYGKGIGSPIPERS